MCVLQLGVVCGVAVGVVYWPVVLYVCAAVGRSVRRGGGRGLLARGAAGLRRRRRLLPHSAHLRVR